jgi:hypothetical protein
MIISLISSMIFFGCSNVLQSASNKTTDAALYEDAQKAMDSSNWDEALAKFGSLSSSYRQKTEVIEAWAGAYAGKCGLDFISYFTSLTSASLSSTTIFKYLMNAWTQKVINPQYCTLAQSKMEEISTNPANRSIDENVFMAILGMVKIGTYLRYYTDKDGANGGGDGSLDAAVNVCTNNASNLADTNLDEIITGMGLITTNLTALTSVIGAGDITNAFDAINTACAASPGSCSKTSTSSINNTDRDLYRDLLNTSQTNPTVGAGIGACANAVFTLCCP